MERDDRLSELCEGKACEILERHNDKYWAKETWCFGVWWDLCPKRGLVEVVGLLSFANWPSSPPLSLSLKGKV